MYEFLELVNNGSAVTTIALSVMVVYLWKDSALKYLKRGPNSPESWFIVGVFIGFLGEAIDGAYWLMVWSINYINTESPKDLFLLGPVINIPFRQLTGIVAAYCHIKSALMLSKKSNPPRWLAVAGGLGLTYIYFLLVLKS